MDLSKAIEILELNLKEAGPKMPPDCAAALALGIEALKRTQELRPKLYPDTIRLLPGETED